MPFVPNTPESLSTLLSRADSKSPSTTCCGVSNAGKPCRRELSPSKSGHPASGVIAKINGQQVFFCGQHKDQSQSVVLRHTASFARKRELLGRGSMDTLIEQVELLVAGGNPGEVTTATTVVSKTKRVSPEDDPFAIPSKNSVITPPSPPTSFQREKGRQQQQQQQQQTQKRKPSFWSKLCCCIPEEAEEDDNMPRERKEGAKLRAAVVENSTTTTSTTTRPARTQRPGKSSDARVVGSDTTPPTPPLPMMYPDRKVVHSALENNGARHGRPGSRGVVAGRGMTPATPKSYTTMSDFGPHRNKSLPESPLIPPALSERTAQRLKQEISKPFSEQDEPGYIYIFWLTDSPISPIATPDPTPSGTPSKPSGPRTIKRNPSEALQQVVTDAENAKQGQRILLKIGRANNVQRRLHEWSTQCGYNLSLIRFYPHVSASSPNVEGSKLTTQSLNKEIGKKVPNSHRIERLIHLELGDNPDNRPQIKCEVCKKTHKEWFSVEASRAGLRGVDEVVKKWVEYGERSAVGAGTTTRRHHAPAVAKKDGNAGNANAKAKPRLSRGKEGIPLVPETTLPPEMLPALARVSLYDKNNGGRKKKPNRGWKDYDEGDY